MALEKFKRFNYFHTVLVYSLAVYWTSSSSFTAYFLKPVQFIPRVGILCCTSKILRLSFKILKQNYSTHLHIIICYSVCKHYFELSWNTNPVFVPSLFLLSIHNNKIFLNFLLVRLVMNSFVLASVKIIELWYFVLY